MLHGAGVSESDPSLKGTAWLLHRVRGCLNRRASTSRNATSVAHRHQARHATESQCLRSKQSDKCRTDWYSSLEASNSCECRLLPPSSKIALALRSRLKDADCGCVGCVAHARRKTRPGCGLSRIPPRDMVRHAAVREASLPHGIVHEPLRSTAAAAASASWGILCRISTREPSDRIMLLIIPKTR